MKNARNTRNPIFKIKLCSRDDMQHGKTHVELKYVDVIFYMSFNRDDIVIKFRNLMKVS